MRCREVGRMLAGRLGGARGADLISDPLMVPDQVPPVDMVELVTDR